MAYDAVVAEELERCGGRLVKRLGVRLALRLAGKVRGEPRPAMRTAGGAGLSALRR